MCKFIFYTINNVLNENRIIFYHYYYKSKKLEWQEKIKKKKKIIRIKETKKY